MSRVSLLTNIISDIQMAMDHCDGDEYDFSLGLMAAKEIVEEYRELEEDNIDENDEL